MKWTQFTIRNLMIATAGLGLVLGFFVRDPDNVIRALRGVAVFGSLGFGILALFAGTTWFSKLPYRTRLIVEILTLVLLLYTSSILWTPSFYPDQASRCDALTQQALRPTQNRPELQAVLDREAAWFTRKARELRWKGWWLGLTRGPSSREDHPDDLLYELGTLESIERHEKRVCACFESP